MSTSRFNLSGRKCLVTGGTRGIGKAIAQELAGLGAEDYERIMGTNLEASYALCQAMQPLLAAGTAGKQPPAADTAAAGQVGSSNSRPTGDALIVFISSVAGGPLAGRSGSLYAVSKAGLNQLAASLACEWASAF